MTHFGDTDNEMGQIPGNSMIEFLAVMLWPLNRKH